jgi:hypothetical protein
MEKNGMLSEKSKSDYDNTKKAEYYDAEGFGVADEAHKDKLNKPEPVKNLNNEETK